MSLCPRLSITGARTKFSSPCLSQDGQTLDPVDLIGFLRPRMAHFMVPRFVRVLADLPKTPTNKVGKTCFARTVSLRTPLIVMPQAS